MKFNNLPCLNPHLGKLKDYSFPSGFVLLVDTREQRPLFTKTKHPDGLTVERRKLDHGDYSIKGFTRLFAIERKQIRDFYSYIGKERHRTTKKMDSFKKIRDKHGFVALSIEADEEDIYYGHIHSQLSPETARQAINSFRIRYGVHVYFNQNRECVKRFVLDSAIKFYNIQREV